MIIARIIRPFPSIETLSIAFNQSNAYVRTINNTPTETHISSYFILINVVKIYSNIIKLSHFISYTTWIITCDYRLNSKQNVENLHNLSSKVYYSIIICKAIYRSIYFTSTIRQYYYIAKENREIDHVRRR